MQRTRKIQDIALLTFAAIGALASLISIVVFFMPPSAELFVTVRANRFELPFIAKTVASRYSQPSIYQDPEKIVDLFCKSSNLQIADKDKYCEDLKFQTIAIKSLADISKFPAATFYEMDIENTGLSQAKGIRLSTKTPNRVDIYNDRGLLVDLEVDRSGDFIVPDLNPRSKLKILVWSHLLPNYDYTPIFSENDMPQITYANGNVVTSLWIHAPNSYASLYDFLNSFHWVVQIIIISLACFLVTFLLLSFFGVLQVMFTSKTWSDVFSLEKPASKILEDDLQP